MAIRKPTPGNQPTDAQDTLALFGASEQRNAYGREITFAMPADDLHRGPGRPARTTGPEDARAPRYWLVEAERVVPALVESGHRVTSDDLRERFSDEPSPTGAATGGLRAW